MKLIRASPQVILEAPRVVQPEVLVVVPGAVKHCIVAQLNVEITYLLIVITSSVFAMCFNLAPKRNRFMALWN